MDNLETVIPFEDRLSGGRYLAHVTPEGAVSAELVGIEPRRTTASPLPDRRDVAESYACRKFVKPWERDSCKQGFLARFAAVSKDWKRGDALPNPWDDPASAELALALDGTRGVEWIDAYERGFKKGTIDMARHAAKRYPPDACL